MISKHLISRPFHCLVNCILLLNAFLLYYFNVLSFHFNHFVCVVVEAASTWGGCWLCNGLWPEISGCPGRPSLCEDHFN